MRLRGKGMPVHGKADVFGDLYVQLQVKIPMNLSEEEKKLVEELRRKQQGRFQQPN